MVKYTKSPVMQANVNFAKRNLIYTIGVQVTYHREVLLSPFPLCSIMNGQVLSATRRQIERPVSNTKLRPLPPFLTTVSMN
jgi:hypothetical protein